VPSWGLGPFVRCPENPLLKPRPEATFFCPIQRTNVFWEALSIVGAAAAVKVGQVYFDCNMTEPGPPPIVTPKGILVIYHGGENAPKHGARIFPSEPIRAGRRSLI